jgi:hypothetical protein
MISVRVLYVCIGNRQTSNFMAAVNEKVAKANRSSEGEAVSPEIVESLAVFMEYYSAPRLSRNLRKMLFEFLMTDNGVESLYFNDLIFDLEGLFTFLDSIEDARKNG